MKTQEFSPTAQALNNEKPVMKTWLRNSLTAIAAVAIVQLMVNCAPKGGGASSSAPTTHFDGTSDPGGGTGVDGKMFESYIFDPVKQPAFEHILKELFTNLGDDSHRLGAAVWFKMKTWYLAPVQLEKVNKDLLGISFIQSDTTQIARQTSREIWIDSRLYPKEEADQADVILHEWAMTLYLVKFAKFSELCRLSSSVPEAGRCTSEQGLFYDKAMPPEVAHPLNKDDNENIRYVTGWLMQNRHRKISTNEMNAILLNHGFDKRFFANGSGDSNRHEEIRLKSKELLRVLQGSQLTNTMPNVCRSVTTDATQKCKIEFKEGVSIPAQNGTPKTMMIEVNITGADGTTIQFSTAVVGDELPLSSSADEDGEFHFRWGLEQSNPLFKIGDRVFEMIVTMKRENLTPDGPLAVESILLKPGVIVSIDAHSRVNPCVVRRPSVINFFDSAMWIEIPGTKLHIVDLLMQTSPPYAYCTSSNVQE